MQQIDRPRPDIRIHSSGQIDIFTSASRRMGIDRSSRISFLLDSEGNLYIRKSRREEGIPSSSCHGKAFFRYHSVEICRRILSMPDIPKGSSTAAFRIGYADDGENWPVITRKIL